VIVDDVEIGNDAENALLLGGHLLGGGNRSSHSDCGERLCDMELAPGQDCVLAWLEDDGG
jgi:hypothetical protein